MRKIYSAKSGLQSSRYWWQKTRVVKAKLQLILSVVLLKMLLMRTLEKNELLHEMK